LTHLSSTRGFTLIELAVVIALVGLAVATTASLAIPIIESSKRIQTEEKIRMISRAIAEYVAVSSSVPCPAQPNIAATDPPYGYSIGTGAAGATMPPGGCQNSAGTDVFRGIVPFRTLNLPEDMVRDGWGNYFIYAVSRNYTRHFLLDLQNQNTNRAVHYHAQCRTRDWYEKVGPTALPLTADLAHITTPKAYFCCGYGLAGLAGGLLYGPATDIVINSNAPVSAATRISPVRTPWPPLAPLPIPPPAQRLVINATDSTTNPVVQPYGGYNTVVAAQINSTDPTTFLSPLDPNSFIPKGESPTTAVYAVVSLGKNGRGRYNVASGGQEDTAGASAAEAVNFGTTLNIIDAPVNDDPANYFDDIVHWETQDMIMAQLGESCATP
jgi:prepilin-type N-terminal cleavage/methylation domain-containing protein